jgi:hypothetical protein
MTATPLGLRLCQIAVPALAIPSALGVSTFFSVADSHPEQCTLQGVIAAGGFELTNIGLSILDIRRPELHKTVQQVRTWSVATAISMNVIAHYATAAAGASGFQPIPFVLALVASVPLALLYVKLAALLHAISEGEHAEQNLLASLQAELAKAREEIASKAKELARLARDLTEARELHQQELARVQGEAREGLTRLANDLARVKADLARARELHSGELARVREGHASQEQELREARETARGAERERAKLQRELEQARADAALLRDRSRDALMGEAQRLQAQRGLTTSEIARELGWPESTVRGWLPANKAVSAAD